jgi:hypothetical protein
MTVFNSTVAPGPGFLFHFNVPLNVYELKIYGEVEIGKLGTFRLFVEPHDVIKTEYDDVNGVFKLYKNAQFVATIGNADAVDDTKSVYAGNVISKVENIKESNLYTLIIYWFDVCPELFTDLHSDFNPLLLPDSSLYLINNQSTLQLNVEIPSYYYNVKFDLNDYCDVLPSVTVENNVCNTVYKTSIDYVTNCPNLTLTIDPLDSTKYLYQGILNVSASIALDFSYDSVVREVISPIRFTLSLDRTVTISSDVIIVNDHTCASDADCNNNGCCENGFCNCTCGTSTRTGYSGTYCENDITFPTCGPEFIAYTINSPHGGCVNLEGRNLKNVTTVYDNDLDLINLIEFIEVTSPSGSVNVSDDSDYCFPIGSNSVKYYLQDNQNNTKECTYTVQVNDVTAPYINCHYCGSSGLLTDYCEGNTVGFTKQTYTSASSFVTTIDDVALKSRSSSGFYNNYLPGQYVNLSDSAFNQPTLSSIKWLDCDCNLVDTEPNNYYVSKTWDSWKLPDAFGIPVTIDTTDLSVIPSYLNDPNADGNYTIIYSAVDAASNNGTCTLEVTYDITKPNCTDFIANITYDPLDLNFSYPLEFDISFFNSNSSVGISGFGSESLVPARSNWTKYEVGSLPSKTHVSTYTIYDGAGNVEHCTFSVFVNGSECTWNTCPDNPPQMHNCPQSATYDCTENSNTGIGAFTPPTFTDDKYVQRIEVYVNGTLAQTYNNNVTNGTSTVQNDLLAIGTTTFQYIAYDMHGSSNDTCTFSITYSDSEKPVVTCPIDETFEVHNASSYDYTYTIPANDTCIFNSTINFTPVGFPLTDEHDNGSETIQVETVQAFSYNIMDEHGNVETCSWTITVKDTGNPIFGVGCPADIVQRIDQGASSTIVTWTTITATDDADPAPAITMTYNPNTPFTEGIYNNTVTATDWANNTVTCNFTITILVSYPFATFDVALIDADVTEPSTGVFKLTMTFTTVVNLQHEVKSGTLTADAAGPGNNNDLLNGDLSEVSSAIGSCVAGDPVCLQFYTVSSTLANCTSNDFNFDFSALVVCIPLNCDEDDKSQSFTISISAGNFCWQDLANVEVTAELKLFTYSSYQQFINDYNLDSTTSLPSETNVFSNGTRVAGIAYVTSNQIETTDVAFVGLDKDHYTASDYSGTPVYSSDLYYSYHFHSNVSCGSYADFASFDYLEADIPLEETYYTKYSGLLQISYNFGNNSSRRMLLSVDQQRVLNQFSDTEINKKVETQAVSVGTIPIDTANEDDAIMMLQLNICSGYTSKWEIAIGEVIAKYLRIPTDTVGVHIQDDSECLFDLLIKSSGCNNINELMDLLQNGVSDKLSDLHVLLFEHQNIPTYSHIDPSFFFVIQTPENVEVKGTINVSSNNDGDSLITDYIMYAYLIAGTITGLVAYNILACCFVVGAGKKREHNKDERMMIEERRYSAAELLNASLNQGHFYKKTGGNIILRVHRI